MTVNPLRPDLIATLKARQLKDVYDEKVKLLEANPRNPGAKFEVVTATKHLKDPNRHYTFRLTKGYRAYCFKPQANVVEVFAIDKHEYR